MQTFRTFVAIPIDTALQRELRNLIRSVSEVDDGIKWVPTKNLHMTLKFLGEVDNVDVPAVCNAAADVCANVEPFSITLAGTGGLPSIHKARVLTVSVNDETGRLAELVQGLEDAYADIGFKREPRDYVPHFTLGRTRGGSSRARDDVMQRLLKFNDQTFGTLTVDEIEMISSFLDKSGPSYQTIDHIELG